MGFQTMQNLTWVEDPIQQHVWTRDIAPMLMLVTSFLPTHQMYVNAFLHILAFGLSDLRLLYFRDSTRNDGCLYHIYPRH